MWKSILVVFILGSAPALSGSTSLTAGGVEGSTLAERSLDETADERLDRGEILVTSEFSDRAVEADMLGVVEAPPDVVWTVLTDINRWADYDIPTLEESRHILPPLLEPLANIDRRWTYKALEFVRKEAGIVPLPRVAGGLWTAYAFQAYDFPWPVSDRWVLLEVTHVERDRKDGNLEARWVKRLGNVREVHGYFRLSPFRENRSRTLVSYFVASDPGIHVPRFLIRYGTRRLMPKIIMALRQETKKPVVRKGVVRGATQTEPP